MQVKASGIDSFRSAIRSAIRGLWSGSIDSFGFYEMLYAAIRIGFSRAWQEGMGQCGVGISEITSEEQLRLDSEINSQFQYMWGFSNTITGNSRALGGRLGPLLERGELWVARYDMIRAIASQMACSDKKLKWIMNPLKEHCSSCLKLNGRVYRASIWKKYNLYPKMSRLACRGFRCGCKFEVTNDPITRGRPPQI